jgi:hypothetical protein
MFSGKAFLVKTLDELTIYKPVVGTELLEEIFFPEGVLHSAIEIPNGIAVVSRNHTSCFFDKETFNKHFEVKL